MIGVLSRLAWSASCDGSPMMRVPWSKFHRSLFGRMIRRWLSRCIMVVVDPMEDSVGAINISFDILQVATFRPQFVGDRKSFSRLSYECLFSPPTHRCNNLTVRFLLQPILSVLLIQSCTSSIECQSALVSFWYYQIGNYSVSGTTFTM